MAGGARSFTYFGHDTTLTCLRCEGERPERLAPGALVQVTGLTKKTSLNNQLGMIVNSLLDDRWAVLTKLASYSIEGSNLQVLKNDFGARDYIDMTCPWCFLTLRTNPPLALFPRQVHGAFRHGCGARGSFTWLPSSHRQVPGTETACLLMNLTLPRPRRLPVAEPATPTETLVGRVLALQNYLRIPPELRDSQNELDVPTIAQYLTNMVSTLNPHFRPHQTHVLASLPTLSEETYANFADRVWDTTQHRLQVPSPCGRLREGKTPGRMTEIASFMTRCPLCSSANIPRGTWVQPTRWMGQLHHACLFAHDHTGPRMGAHVRSQRPRQAGMASAPVQLQFDLDDMHISLVYPVIVMKPSGSDSASIATLTPG